MVGCAETKLRRAGNNFGRIVSYIKLARRDVRGPGEPDLSRNRDSGITSKSRKYQPGFGTGKARREKQRRQELKE